MAKAKREKHHGGTEASGDETTGPTVYFTADDKEVLVKIVKVAQGRKVKGSKGDWKEFLRSRDEKFGLPSDPERRSWDVLASFVNTFIAEEDIQMVMRFMKWNKRLKRRQLLTSKFLHPECPEQELVRLTYEHPRFWQCYTFPSYHEGWMMTKLGKLSKETNVDRMLAIDCEMVRCEDGIEEVVKVCVVDRNLETLIDTLVKPSKPVVNYLTPITGVKAEDLEGVTCNLRDIQKMLKKLLIPGTIVVGHSLHHDLKVLRIDHARVIDTAFIFRYQNRPIRYTPGLSKLCKVVLGHDLREEGKPHVCLDDAIYAMKLTLAKLDRGLNDALDMDNFDGSEADLIKLLIHRIPRNVSIEELQNLFPKKYAVEIEEFSDEKYKPHTTFAIFKDPKDVDEAFENLKGELEVDSSGRPQKSITFPKPVTVCVRKMKVAKIEAPDSQLSDCNGNVAPFTMKRPNESMDSVAHVATDGESLQNGKKRKIDKEIIEPMINIVKECNDCLHLKEQQRLMKELEERDAEIRNLQAIVSALTRNNCL